MSIELAHAYVSLSVSTKGMAKDVERSLKGLDPQATKAGQSMGGRLTDAMGGVLKKSAAGVGIAAMGAMGAAMTKGLGRLTAIEGAEAKLSGLGNSASQVSGIMENALAAVRGTAFGLEEAGSVAAAMVAAGIQPGQQLESVLKTVGDTAAIAGVSMQDMGSIFGKVAATGKLQGDELMQLSDAGIPALSLLSKHLGKTSAEVRDMVSKGQIDFQTFADAMQSGMGGAALKMGETTTGAFKNMTAAAGRLGATLAGPFYTQAGGAFRGLTTLIDGLDSRMKPVMADLDRWITGTAVPALQDLGAEAVAAFKQFAASELASTSLIRLEGVFHTVAAAVSDILPPLARIGSALAEASARLGVSAWKAFLAVLEAGAALLGALAPPLELIADLMESQPGLVTAALAAWMGFKTIPAIMAPITPALAKATASLTAMTTAARLGGASFVKGAQQVGVYSAAMNRLVGVSPLMNNITTAMIGANTRMGALAAGAKAGLAPAFGAAKAAGSSLLSMLGGPLGAALLGVGVAATSAISANNRLESAQRNLEEASRDLGTAQKVMWAEIGDASGVAEAVVAQVKAVNDEISAGIAGEQRGFGANVSAWWKNLTSADLTSFSWNPQMTGSAGSDAQEMANQIADASRRAQESLREIGATDKDVAAAIQGSSGEWDAFVGRLHGTANGGTDAVNKLQPLRDEFVAMQGVANRVGENYMSLETALNTLSDASAAADQQLSALRNTMELLGFIQTSAAQQIADTAAAVENVGDVLSNTTVGVDEFGNAFLNADGTLNTHNASARELASAYSALSDEVLTMARNGASADEIMAAMGPQFDAVSAQAAAAGLDVNALNDQFGLIPSDIQAAISVAGLDEVEQDVLAVTEKLRGLPPSSTTSVHLEGGQAAVAELERLGIKVSSFDAETGEATVWVESADAHQKLQDIQNDLLNIPDADAAINVDSAAALGAISAATLGVTSFGLASGTANLYANNAPVVAATNGATALINGMNNTSGTGTLYADTNPLTAGVTNGTSMIVGLDQVRGTGTLDANGQPAANAVNTATGQINSVNGVQATGQINANNADAVAKVQEAKRWYDSIPLVKTTQVVFNAIYNGFRNLGGGDGNALGGAWTGQRALPHFAHGGYRLPTTGPGTGVTDGFMAWNSDGIPSAMLDAGEWIINRRSSEKYNKELAQINAGTFPKLPGYADGGKHAVKTNKEMLDFAWGRTPLMRQPLQGAIYDWGNQKDPHSWGDCSGTASRFAGFATGQYEGKSATVRLFSTADEAAVLTRLGFTRGMGSTGDLRIGFKNGGPGGGHTASTLPDGTKVEMGGGAGGNGKINNGAVGHDDPQFTDHFFLPAIKYAFSHIEGADGLMPPSFTTSGVVGGSTTYKGSKPDRPTTWSEVAGQAAKDFVSGQVEDVLGVFGVPNQLPPFIEAWRTLNTPPEEGGPTDWDLSKAAARVKQLDAQIELQSRLVSEATGALDAMASSPVGDLNIGTVTGARKRIADMEADIESARQDREIAVAHLEELVGAREAALAAKNSAASAAGASASELSGMVNAPDADGMLPDSITKELRITYDPAKGAEQWRPMVEALLKEKGQPVEYADAVIKRIKQESNGDPSAVNNWDSNAKRGTPSKGLLQTIQPTFDTYKDPGHGDILNPEDNMRASMNYVLRDPKFRGRTLKDVYLQAGGYWNGGPVPFGSGRRDDVPLVAAQGEFIVNRDAAQKNRGLLERINNGQEPQRSGDTINVYAFDLHDAVRTMERRSRQRALAGMGVR